MVEYNDPVYVYHVDEQGNFMRHILDYDTDYFGQTTYCEIEQPFDDDGNEINWYFEHERDDVVICERCGTWQPENH